MKKKLPVLTVLCLLSLFWSSCANHSSKTAMEPKAPMPYWLQEPFNTDSLQPALVSPVFKNGYILLSQRDEPGLLYLLNAKGTVVWYHQVKGTGFKTAHFTENKTLLCILGSKEYATSYGNEIMELSLKGDTLLHLKKGQQDFINNVHHEVLLSPGNNIVTLSTEERLVDLTARGGGPKDTVRSDGILVMDRKGNKVWQWSVFDALQPVNDKDIIRTRMDWMHANSLSFDKDGNYLISFYNNGQIWKLDAKTGKIIWKFGKGGDFKYPATAAFDMGHSVHINSENNLMLFDNGVSRQLSQTLAFKLNETTKEATVTIQSPIPSYLFNDRMGSAYLVDSNSILQCCSKRNTVILTDRKGTLLWRLRCSFIPYRAEFITKEQLPAFIVN